MSIPQLLIVIFFVLTKSKLLPLQLIISLENQKD